MAGAPRARGCEDTGALKAPGGSAGAELVGDEWWREDKAAGWGSPPLLWGL